MKTKGKMAEPSSGGIGIKLNIIKTKLMVMIEVRSKGMLFPVGMKFKNSEKITAVAKLATGPASAVRSRSFNGFLKLYGLTGTGFAQPNTKPVPEKMRSAGSKTVPTRSMCFMGFRVTRPAYLAVGSPKRSAAMACADSWTTIATMKPMIEAMIGSI